MKYLCIDIGNVLCEVNMDLFIKSLYEACNISEDDAKSFLRRFQKMHDLGYTTLEEELKEKLGIKSKYTVNKLILDWNETLITYESNINLLNKLSKEYDLKIALLSNVGIEHASIMADKLRFDGFFDSTIKWFSCEVGARKPSTIYYQSFLTAYPEFTGALYIDDLQENLDVGSKLGLNSFKFDLTKSVFEDKIKEIELFITNG